MGEDRFRVAEGPEEEDVLRRVGEVILAADDVGDAHRRVVDHHGEVVERRAVAADDDEVAAEGGGVELDVAPDEVVEGDHAGLDPEAQRRAAALGLARCTPGRRQGGAAADVAGRLLRRLLGLPVGLELLGRAVAGVGPILRHEGGGRLRVARQARHLAVRPEGTPLGALAGGRALVPFEAEPVEVLQDVALELDGGAGLVGVLQAQDERPADMAGEEEVEEGRAGRPDVEGARGAGGDADAGVGHGPDCTGAALSPGGRPRARGGRGRGPPRRGGRGPGRRAAGRGSPGRTAPPG